MIQEYLRRAPWVVVGVKGQLYGLSSSCVRDMVRLPGVTEMPNVPPEIRGVINLRGHVTPLLDLRVMLGMQSAGVELEETIENLIHREQDHKNWLAKLETAVAERTHFTGELDPHKCAFGKWYDNYATSDLVLKGLLKRFDRPHKHIHSIGATVNDLVENGRYEEAESIIKATHDGELAEMINLFSLTRDVMKESQREIAVLIYNDKKTMAMAVDTIESVEMLDDNSFEEPPMQNVSTDRGLISAVARRVKDNALIMLLDAAHILSGGIAAAA